MKIATFYLKPRAEKRTDGRSLLYLFLRIDGKLKEISTGEYVFREDWDFKKRCLKISKRRKKELLEQSLVHEDILSKCRDIVRDAQKTGEILDHKGFARKLQASGTAFNLIAFTKDYIKQDPHNWSPATRHSYEGLIAIMEDAYDGSITGADIPELRTKMEKYLVKKNSCLNTRKKRHTQLKSMLKRARKAGYPLPDPYQEPIGVVKGHRNFLNMEELNKTIDFYNAEYLPGNLQRTLGQFLFSCFTGCRYSDMVELNHKNIVGTTLEYVALKTRRFHKVVQAPLPEVAKVIIPNSMGRLFDMKTDQVTNRHLKRIFRRIGINKHLTFHCARHTFATLYIYLGGDITNLQEIMAHEDITTTMIYVKMAKRLEAHDLKIFDDAFAERMKVITGANTRWEVA